MNITRWFRNKPRWHRRSFILGLLLFIPIPGLAIWHAVVNHWAAAKVDEHLTFLESTRNREEGDRVWITSPLDPEPHAGDRRRVR